MIRLLIPVPYLARYHAVTYTRSLTYASSKPRRSRPHQPRTPTEPTTTQPPTPDAPLSSFRGSTATNAFCTVRDPNSPDPLATHSIIVGLDSYSDVTVAHRDIAYNIHCIAETVGRGLCELKSPKYWEAALLKVGKYFEGGVKERWNPLSIYDEKIILEEEVSDEEHEAAKHLEYRELLGVISVRVIVCC